MTPRQSKALYWPAWGRAYRRNWTTDRGRLSRLPDATTGEWIDAVAAEAVERSRHYHRAPIAEDLRHACHTLAVGRDVSSKDLNNAQLDRVVTLFALLEEPDNINAVMAWQNPNLSAEKRLDWVIQHAAPEAYVRQIAGDKFGTRAWEALTIEQKRQLAMTLRERQGKWNRPVSGKSEIRNPKSEPETDPANVPF